MSNNLGDFAGSVLFEYQHVRVLNIVPNYGPVLGGTTVVVQGTQFAAGEILCQFGGSVVPAIFLSGAEISCVTPVCHALPGPVTVQVINTEATYLSTIEFTFEPQPVVVSVVPQRGPAAGGTTITLYGAGLVNANDMFCLIGSNSALSRFWSPTRVECVTPAVSTAGAVNITVSRRPSQTSYPLERQFIYEEDPKVEYLTPCKGPLTGGTLVTVFGRGFSTSSAAATTSRCLFNDTAVEASLVSSTTLLCRAPLALYEGFVEVEVTHNLYDYSSTGILYEYVAAQLTSLSPVSGPNAGGTVVTITGSNLLHSSCLPAGQEGTSSSEAYCQFGAVVTHATQVSASSVACRAPAVPTAQLVSVRVEQRGATYRGGLHFAYHEIARVSSLSPLLGPLAGGTTVQVHGAHFRSTEDAQCKFQTVERLVNHSTWSYVVPAIWHSRNRFDCVVTNGSTRTTTGGAVVAALFVAVEESCFDPIRGRCPHVRPSTSLRGSKLHTTSRISAPTGSRSRSTRLLSSQASSLPSCLSRVGRSSLFTARAFCSAPPTLICCNADLSRGTASLQCKHRL